MQILLKDLSKRYQDADRSLTVLDNVNFSFPESGSVAILGRSGIGKSTLLHLLGGLDRPSSGTILYDGVNLASLDDEELSSFRGRNVGFIFQFHHLLGEFTALENVGMPLLISGCSESEAEQRAEEILRRVGLGDRMLHRPGELSGGEQQRVAIARALITEPRVVLADEPTGNLDIETARAVQTLLLEMNRELKNVLVVVTHSRELALEMGIVTEMLPGGQLSAVS